MNMKHAQQIRSEVVATKGRIEHEGRSSIRLNKYISNTGYCSRREADRYIEQGQVNINGCMAQIGDKVYPQQQVIVAGTPIHPKESFMYIALYKPIGITCTTDRTIENNIVDYLNHTETVFPIGRLDKETSGLILMTNDGDVVNKILRSSFQHEKEYIVQVDKDIKSSFIKKIKMGVNIYNPVTNAYQVTNPCTVKQLDTRRFSLILTQGLNRQIRRMCSALDYHVVMLERIRVMHITLATMRIGTWRYLTEEELEILNYALKQAPCDTNV